MNRFGKLDMKTHEEKPKKIMANHNYSPVLQGNEYLLIEEGLDFYKIKCKGAPYYADKWIFDTPPPYVPKWEEDDE